MSQKSLIILGSLALTALFSCQDKGTNKAQLKDAWNRLNDPTRLGDIYDQSYATLPKKGRLDQAPWSDSYWPSNQGGIASRWQNPSVSAWDYRLNSADEVKKMSTAAIAALSPAEKWDIYSGDYSYPTVASERDRVSPGLPSWEGICHAWAPAALLYQEPKPIVATNAQGIKVSFGSSDIKAMISYALHLNPAAAGIAGTRCEETGGVPGAGSQQPCNDTNAGSFHIMLANLVGTGKPGFVIDVTRDQEVWNQPVYAYAAKEVGRHGPSSGAASGTVTEIDIENTVQYGLEINPTWAAVVGTSSNSIVSKVYKYRLELDSKNKIIGGEWLQTDRPDFAWRTLKKTDLATLSGPTGSYAPLNSLWLKSIGQGNGTVVVPPVVVPPVVVPPVVVPPVVVPPVVASECKNLSRSACLASAPICLYVDAVPGISENAECQKNWNQ